MLNACVLKLVLSPPAPACRTTNWLTLNVLPRSTWRNLVAAPEHHLSLRPPVTLPFTALAGPSFELHGALPVAGLFRARFDGEGVGGGGFGGGVGPPRWNSLAERTSIGTPDAVEEVGTGAPKAAGNPPPIATSRMMKKPWSVA